MEKTLDQRIEEAKEAVEKAVVATEVYNDPKTETGEMWRSILAERKRALADLEHERDA